MGRDGAFARPLIVVLLSDTHLQRVVAVIGAACGYRAWRF